MIGTTLGHYQMEALLGAGGMGEVYRARDVKLGREVAIKVLPEAVLSEPDRVARFEREAKVLAALNHANIAALFGMEESDGRHFLIMELVRGAQAAGAGSIVRSRHGTRSPNDIHAVLREDAVSRHDRLKQNVVAVYCHGSNCRGCWDEAMLLSVRLCNALVELEGQFPFNVAAGGGRGRPGCR